MTAPAQGDDLAAAAEALLGPVAALEPVAGGRNNRVARAAARDGSRAWLVKAYAHHPDGLARLEREWGLVRFLWGEGLRCVPEPVAVDRERRVAAFGWVEGRKLRAGEVAAGDVAALARFLGELWALRRRPGASDLPLAAEATFTAGDLLASVEGRLARLVGGIEPDAIGRDALDFLRDDFAPALAGERARLVGAGVDLAAPVPAAERTLSPSDHGFHNALRTASGWVFVDHEYGGWDDPAKALADACLQPAVPIPDAQRAAFLGHALDLFGRPPGLAVRLRHLFPLWSLKWCLILLNELLPAGLERRRRAGLDVAPGSTDPRPAQLALARDRLAALARDREALFEGSAWA